MNLVLVSPPASSEILALVSVADLKANLRITNSAEDTVAEQKILASYDWLAGEFGWLNRTLITTEYKAVLPGFVNSETYYDSTKGGPTSRNVATSVIELPKPPLVSVQSVKYLASGVQETLDPAGYNVAVTSLFGTVSLASGAAWPTTIDTNSEAVEIAFTAGYGSGAQVKARCPGIVQALLLLASDAFRNREDTYAEARLVAVDRKIINGVQRFAGRYRILNDHA